MHIQKMTCLPFRHTDSTVHKDRHYNPVFIPTSAKVTEPGLGPVRLKMEFVSCLPSGRCASLQTSGLEDAMASAICHLQVTPLKGSEPAQGGSVGDHLLPQWWWAELLVGAHSQAVGAIPSWGACTRQPINLSFPH